MSFIPIQLKIQCNVKVGLPPPPGSLPAKRGDDAGMSSEDDGLPRSPPEMSLLHDIGPSTTIKASQPAPHVSILTHHRGQLGAQWPLCDSHEARLGMMQQEAFQPGYWNPQLVFIFILRAEIQVLLGDRGLVTFFLMFRDLIQSTPCLVFPV